MDSVNSSIKVDSTGIRMNGGVDLKVPLKSDVVLIQIDDKVTCCVDGICEEFTCPAGATFENRMLTCGGSVLKEYPTKPE